MASVTVTIQKSWCPEFTVQLSSFQSMMSSKVVQSEALEFLRKFTGVHHVVTKEIIMEEQVTGTWASFCCRSGIDNQGEIVVYWEVG